MRSTQRSENSSLNKINATNVSVTPEGVQKKEPLKKVIDHQTIRSANSLDPVRDLHNNSDSNQESISKFGKNSNVLTADIDREDPGYNLSNQVQIQGTQGFFKKIVD